MADELITCISQHQALFGKQHANYKDNNFNIWQSIADQLGFVNGE